MFVYDRERNFFLSAIIGGTPAIAAGIAWALKRKGSNQRVWCFVGDGTEDNGHLSEAVRYVDGHELPCTFVIESNDRSCEASNTDRWGKTAHPEWNSPSVIRYQYDCVFILTVAKPGMINLGEAQQYKKTDNEYFPPLKKFEYPTYEVSESLSYKEAMCQSMTELGDQGYIFYWI